MVVESVYVRRKTKPCLLAAQVCFLFESRWEAVHVDMLRSVLQVYLVMRAVHAEADQ